MSSVCGMVGKSAKRKNWLTRRSATAWRHMECDGGWWNLAVPLRHLSIKGSLTPCQKFFPPLSFGHSTALKADYNGKYSLVFCGFFPFLLFWSLFIGIETKPLKPLCRCTCSQSLDLGSGQMYARFGWNMQLKDNPLDWAVNLGRQYKRTPTVYTSI